MIEGELYNLRSLAPFDMDEGDVYVGAFIMKHEEPPSVPKLPSGNRVWVCEFLTNFGFEKILMTDDDISWLAAEFKL